MNPSRLIVFAAASGMLCVPALAQGNGRQSAIPAVPAGLLTATPKVVQTGTYPTLTWQVHYPSTVGDVAVINPPGGINLTDGVFVDVRVVGVGVTEGTAGQNKNDIPTETRISINGGNYSQLFYGTNTDVDPTHSLFTKKLPSGTSINFGGRYVKDGSWTSFTTTQNPNYQVVALKSGDKIPTSYDLKQSGNMAEYLKPYVNGDGTVKVGPMSLLVMAEYGSTNHSSAAFDYQDLVLLVSFSSKNNNGHGNNIDGVDSSNPGQGSGGPNGGTDPSGDVDDERTR